ncbi:MAG TPA: YihY/virulence factor BrkB family protein [Aestuariivirgaceae bacterium]|jgi:membrane protein
MNSKPPNDDWHAVWRQVVARVWRKSRHDHLSVVAAGCAFYAFFAIFPALSAVISLYGLTAVPTEVERTFGVLSAILPPQAYDIVIDQIRYIAGSSTHLLGWNFALSLLLALWSTNAGVQAIFASLNIAYGERERRSPLYYYISVLTFSIAGITGGVIMLFALIYVPILFALAGFSREFELIVYIGRWPFLAILTLLLIELLYCYGPSRKKAAWQLVSIGSLSATALCLAATASFSLYVSNIANYSRTYGSLGAVVVMLLWLYISFYITLLGAQTNAILERHGTLRRASGRPKCSISSS